MRLHHYPAILAGLLGTAFSLTKDFDPIFKPEKGDVIEANSTYTIEWTSVADYSGPVNLMLESGNDTNSLNRLQIITPMVESHAREYQWNVPQSVPPNETFYIRIGYIDDYTVVNYSPPFKIRESHSAISGNQTTTAASSSTTMATTTTTTTTSSTATGSSTGSPSTSAPTSTSTSTGAGSAATPIVHAPFALVGAVAFGMFAL